MAALLILGLFVGFLLFVPLLILGFLFRLLIGLIFLPLKIAGFAVRLGVGLAVGLVALIAACAVLLIPLLPILFLIGGIWLIIRLSRRQPAARWARGPSFDGRSL